MIILSAKDYRSTDDRYVDFSEVFAEKNDNDLIVSYSLTVSETSVDTPLVVENSINTSSKVGFFISAGAKDQWHYLTLLVTTANGRIFGETLKIWVTEL